MLRWLLYLFNPPPLDSMTSTQKVGRVLLFTVSLVTLSIISAMVVAAGIFVFERAPQVFRTIEFSDFRIATKVIAIILLSAGVNTLCIIVLFQIRKLDRNLMKSGDISTPL